MRRASWTNGEYQQAQQHFQPSQSSLQLTRTSVGSYQGGTASNATLSGPVIRGLNSQDVAFVSKNGIWQQAYMITQIGNGHLVNNATAHSQVATQPHGHPPNLSDTKTNTTYCRQDMSAQVNRMVSSHGNQLQWMQNGNPMSNNHQHNMVQRSLHQNGNGVSTQLFLEHKEGVTSTSSNQQIRLINQSVNDNQSAQQSAIPYNPQIRHNIHMSPINRPVTTNSLPSTHNYHTSNGSYINSGGVATSSINMNLKSQSAQQVGCFPIPQPHYNPPQLSKNEPVIINVLPSKQNCQNSSRIYVSGTQVVASSSGTNPNHNQYQPSLLTKLLVGTGQHIPRQQRTNSGENISLEAPPQTFCRPTYGNSQFVSKGMTLESNHTMQPVAYSAAESCNSKPSTLPPLTQQPLAKNISSMPTLQRGADKPPQQSFASQNFSSTPTTGGSGNTLNRDSVELKHQLTAEKESEMLAELEMFIHLYSNDNSIHSSGHAVPKAVAVVPPLSQNNIDTASECTSSIKQCSQYTEVGKPLPEGLKEASPHLRDTCKTPPKTSNTPSKPSSTPVTPSELPQSQNTNQKIDSTSDRQPELSVNMETKQRFAQASPCEVLKTQNSAMDDSETPADPRLCASDLSSVPTVQWTVQELRNYINLLMRTEKSKPPSTSCNNKLKIWGDLVKDIAGFYPDTYRSIVTSMCALFGKSINPNTVTLTEVKDGFKKHVHENYRVLKDDEIYKEVPYVSSWLNINEKLDDIDKEFGFAWSLKARRLSDSEAQEDCTSMDTNADISNEAPDKSSSQMELEPANSHQEESNADENSSKLCASPTESCADDSDPHYSFTIQVLPPEEAKMIFEENRIRLKEDSLPQKTTERCTKSDSPSIVNDSLKTTDVSQVQQICCLTKWMETIIGESSDFMSKCECKAHKDGTNGKFTSAKQAQVEENSDENMTSSLTQIDDTFILNDDSIGAGDILQEACKPENICHDSRDVIFTSDNKDQEQVPNQTDNPVEDSEQAPIESPGSSRTSEEMEKKTEIVTSDSSFSDIDGDSIQSELKSSDMPEPPMEEEGNTHTHARAPVLSPARPSKSKNEMRTAELVLFGSTSQGARYSGGQTSSLAMLPEGTQRPPKMLSVDIRPLKPTTSETLRTGNCSVKIRLYEKWRRSLIPLTLRHNKANGVKKLPGQRASFMKAKRFGSASTKDRSLKLDVRDKQFLDQKKKGFRGLKKWRKNLLTKPTECRSRGVVDPQEDSVLGFNVLPKTFSFKDGSNKNNNTTGSVTGKTLHTEADNDRPSKAVKRKRDAWFPKPEKLYSPLRQTTIHTTGGAFYEFQKKYMEKTQTPTDA